MIDILHRETETVILTVNGEWRNYANLGGQYAVLEGIDLSGARLADADLAFARLRGSILAGADLSEAYLASADLTGADLSGATLRRADCLSVRFRRANLTKADLSYATLQSTDWRGAILTGANLARATLKGGHYDQFTIWPEGFVPHKHHLIYRPSTARRQPDRASK
jgi:uncharacterized protein YjbI with pentapeptide repeats